MSVDDLALRHARAGQLAAGLVTHGLQFDPTRATAHDVVKHTGETTQLITAARLEVGDQALLGAVIGLAVGVVRDAGDVGTASLQAVARRISMNAARLET